MAESPSSKIGFSQPPVVEVALSVQFDPLPTLHVAQLGLFWAGIRDRFPTTEDYPAVPAAIERFGGRPEPSATLEIKLLDAAEVPRVWFLDPGQTRLIQIQRDRLSYNWRKGDAPAPYPSYDRMRHEFGDVVGLFEQFLQRESLGELTANQCEITYVDHFVSGSGWERHGELGQVLSVWSPPTDAGLPEPEQVRLLLRYVIPGEAPSEPLGRLHVEVNPAIRLSDSKPIFVMNSTARGRPLGSGLEGVLRFLDTGHDWALRVFLAITTETMHQNWRKADGC
jgi:uncharacterized protein (TIGR04255 family)